MTEATHAAVRDLYDAYARRDFDHVGAMLDEEVDWIIYGPIEVFPFHGPRRGRAAVLKAIGDLAKDYSIERMDPEIVIVEGDRAAIMANVSFLQRNTQRTLSFRLADFLRFREGRVIEFREFMNTFDAVEQALGHWLKVE